MEFRSPGFFDSGSEGESLDPKHQVPNPKQISNSNLNTICPVSVSSRGIVESVRYAGSDSRGGLCGQVGDAGLEQADEVGGGELDHYAASAGIDHDLVMALKNGVHRHR